MRKLRFRVWDGKKMWYPDSLTPDENETHIIFFNRPTSIGWGLYEDGTDRRLVSGEYHQIMQYTGLKDKNGKEIYEGDIVKWLWANGENKEVMHSTSWEGRLPEVNAPFISAWGSTDGRYYRAFMNVYNPCRFAIVIGNIYENPELLNNEQGVQWSVATKMPNEQKPD